MVGLTCGLGCRIAIEQNKPVDVEGLVFGHTGVDALRNAEIWLAPNSIFELRFSTDPGRGRVCRVLIQDGRWPEDVGELLTVAGTFEAERNALIEAGLHEWRPFDRAGQYAGAIWLKARNANNCPVVSALIISTGQDRLFMGMVGEQVADPCSESYPVERGTDKSP